MEDGAAGYAVVWKKGESWAGIKTHLGYNQEAYDAECAALTRALESASRRNTTGTGGDLHGCASGHQTDGIG